MATSEEELTIDVKLFVDREKKKVLFAESDKEFVDVLFSFLTMPLGTIVRLLDKQSQMGCLDELYKSVEDLSCTRCKSSWPFFGSGATKILQVEESAPNKLQVNSCFKCFKLYGYRDNFLCKETPKSTEQCELNPKSPNGGGKREAYVKGGHMKLMVTDGLRILPLALSTTLEVVSDAKIKTNELVEEEIALSKFQVFLW
ncbi:hypothetical protein HU200_033061 [Digitaria exilis]|uniref:Uncharacterized protein n=1 Tax=Digitaria exilis TaxID=1010633 RepID=A0A835EQ08_9POAL|nr:hypothetical protein HU200_033061 [Digitaria exilis]